MTRICSWPLQSTDHRAIAVIDTSKILKIKNISLVPCTDSAAVIPIGRLSMHDICSPHRLAVGRGVKATLTYTGSGSGWRLAVTRWRAGNARQAQAQLMAAFIPPPCECDELHPPTPTDDGSGSSVVVSSTTLATAPYSIPLTCFIPVFVVLAGPGGQEHARVLFLG